MKQVSIFSLALCMTLLSACWGDVDPRNNKFLGRDNIGKFEQQRKDMLNRSIKDQQTR